MKSTMIYSITLSDCYSFVLILTTVCAQPGSSYLPPTYYFTLQQTGELYLLRSGEAHKSIIMCLHPPLLITIISQQGADIVSSDISLEALGRSALRRKYPLRRDKVRLLPLPERSHTRRHTIHTSPLSSHSSHFPQSWHMHGSSSHSAELFG